MPTTNPRINVTLAPSTNAMVEKLARLQRCSKSTVLRELLEASEPMLGQAVAMMEAANELGSQARKKVATDMGATLKEVERKSHAAIALAAGITNDLVTQAEAIRGRRPPRKAPAVGPSSRRASEGRKPARLSQDPPPSNRGVKS